VSYGSQTDFSFVVDDGDHCNVNKICLTLEPKALKKMTISECIPPEILYQFSWGGVRPPYRQPRNLRMGNEPQETLSLRPVKLILEHRLRNKLRRRKEQQFENQYLVNIICTIERIGQFFTLKS
jgi:hypothetical protein